MLYMSFSRINYDESAYDLKMERSTAPGDYRFFPHYHEIKDKCYPYNDPTNGKQQVSLVREDCDMTFTDMAHVESILTNRIKPLQNGNLEGKNDEHLKEKVHHKQNCTNYLEMEDTRFTNPVDTYRGMSLTEFFFTPYLHVNPQCQYQTNVNKVGNSSRLWVKDNYTTPDQNEWDEGEGLPPKVKSEIPEAEQIGESCTYTCK